MLCLDSKQHENATFHTRSLVVKANFRLGAEGRSHQTKQELNIHSRLIFWITYPFIVGAFKWRALREWRKIVPRRWLSPADVVAEDLELFEPRDRFDIKFIDDFAKARDDIMSLTKKQTIISMLIFLFLLSNYLAVGLDVSLGGFSLRYSTGVAEGLLLVSNMLSCYTLILQANSSILDATIKSAIKFGVPEELRTLYLVRYFPHEQFGRYQPFNMPYLIPTKLQPPLPEQSPYYFWPFWCSPFLYLPHVIYFS